MKIIIIRISLFVCLFTIVSSTLLAETVQQSPVIVTATRTAQTADESLASVTVITRKDIDRLQKKSLSELLSGVAGINISTNGGYGKTTGINLRGTNPNHVLVLIDGIKIGSATTGQAAFQHIPVSQIERIEIVRGPLSSLYGAEALGGVIQIFTRKGNPGTQFTANAGVGELDTNEAGAGISGSYDFLNYSVHASHFETKGIDAFTGGSSDRDGYRNQSVTANFGVQLPGDAALNFNFLHAYGNNEFDDFLSTTSVDDEDFVQQTAGVKLMLKPLSDWKSSFLASRSLDESKNFSNSIPNGTFNTKRYMVSWQNDITLADNHILTGGLDYQRDEVDSTTRFTQTKRDNTGIFFQYQWYGEQYNLQASIRNDDNEAFGNHTTGSVALGYDITDTLRATASYGSAFRAPTFNELFFPNIGFFAGNPNLQPETSHSVEIGLLGNYDSWHWDVRAYQTDIDNLIEFVFGTPTSVNIGKARINGLETRLSMEADNWTASTQITLIDPQNRDNGRQLLRRPKTTIRVDVDRQFTDGHIGFTVLTQSQRSDGFGQIVRLGGYTLVGLRGEYKITKYLSLQGRIDNLFDEQYQTINNFNSLDRNAFFSLVFKHE